MSTSDIQAIVNRLYSQDANDRVKAAGEIGEVGTPQEAPIILKVAYEDEASTVRQMAIQSYYEILNGLALAEIKKASMSHFDEYVKIYAISILGNYAINEVQDTFEKLIESSDSKIQITTVKALIHANGTNFADKLLQMFPSKKSDHLSQVIVEAMALWNFKKASKPIEKYYITHQTVPLELKTILLFAMASFGNKNAKKSLETEEIDNFSSIKVGDKRYRGRNGLLEALKKI